MGFLLSVGLGLALAAGECPERSVSHIHIRASCLPPKCGGSISCYSAATPGALSEEIGRPRRKLHADRARLAAHARDGAYRALVSRLRRSLGDARASVGARLRHPLGAGRSRLATILTSRPRRSTGLRRSDSGPWLPV